MNYEPLTQLPMDIQQDWMAQLSPATPTDAGAFRLVAVRRTLAGSFEERRVTVLILDEDGIAMPGVPVAFSYSTADFYVLTADFKWRPPSPQRAFVVSTNGGGQIDQIQGSAVKRGQPGGITVYVLRPEYSSDVVTGCGMLADHTGLHLTFQLRRTGMVSLSARVSALEQWITSVDDKIRALTEGR